MPRNYGLTRRESAGIQRMTITYDVLTSILVAAKISPREICGALYGVPDGQCARILAWKQLELDATVDSFELPLARLFALVNPPGTRLVGIIHSHPGADPDLSLVDHWYARLSPFIWGVVGLGNGSSQPAARFFLQASGKVIELRWEAL